MSKMKIIYCLLLSVFIVTAANGQKPSKNDCPRVSGAGYVLGISLDGVGSDKSIYLQISLKKKDFNREFMLKFVKRLKSDYCRYNRISVMIFDRKKLARNSASPIVYVESNMKIIPMRGFYNLNRITGEEGLEFSTEPGKPPNQVKIDFKDGEPIL